MTNLLSAWWPSAEGEAALTGRSQQIAGPARVARPKQINTMVERTRQGRNLMPTAAFHVHMYRMGNPQHVQTHVHVLENRRVRCVGLPWDTLGVVLKATGASYRGEFGPGGRGAGF